MKNKRTLFIFSVSCFSFRNVRPAFHSPYLPSLRWERYNMQHIQDSERQAMWEGFPRYDSRITFVFTYFVGDEAALVKAFPFWDWIPFYFLTISFTLNFYPWYLPHFPPQRINVIVSSLEKIKSCPSGWYRNRHNFIPHRFLFSLAMPLFVPEFYNQSFVNIAMFTFSLLESWIHRCKMVNRFVSMDTSCIITHQSGVFGTPGSVFTHLPTQTLGCVSFKLHLAVTFFSAFSNTYCWFLLMCENFHSCMQDIFI